MPAGIEQLLTLKQVADILNYEPKTIQNWVDNRDIKYRKMPRGGIRFDPDYIRDLGRIDFKSEGKSPEVARLERQHKRENEAKDELIEKLRAKLREVGAIALQSENDIFNTNEYLKLFPYN